MTRSLGAMTRFDVADALGWHPLGPALAVVSIGVVLALLVAPRPVLGALRSARDWVYRIGLRRGPQVVAVLVVGVLWLHQAGHLTNWEAAHNG